MYILLWWPKTNSVICCAGIITEKCLGKKEAAEGVGASYWRHIMEPGTTLGSNSLEGLWLQQGC